MTHKTPWSTKKKDPGAYGHIMINRIVGGLPLSELQEYEKLEKIKPKKRTPDQQARMEVLWAEATKLHSEARSRGEVWNAKPDSEAPAAAS
jgi:hypothetical protein